MYSLKKLIAESDLDKPLRSGTVDWRRGETGMRGRGATTSGGENISDVLDSVSHFNNEDMLDLFTHLIELYEDDRVNNMDARTIARHLRAVINIIKDRTGD